MTVRHILYSLIFAKFVSSKLQCLLQQIGYGQVYYFRLKSQHTWFLLISLDYLDYIVQNYDKRTSLPLKNKIYTKKDL